ncbi:MAG: transcriptional repressor [Helicobacteraceae bacterium]|jgi:Fur family zinc uptake transcriptional regulator|nr:transcriptional repressor [Helicobacteraceae bacterium]
MKKSALKKSQRLRLAENLCADNKTRLTLLRRKALEILLNAKTPLKAYDIIELMRDEGKRVTPATIYRVLEFLLDSGLVHRINALSAYAPCANPQNGGRHSLVMFVCSKCKKVEEIDDDALNQSMRARLDQLGFSLQEGSVEMEGECKTCTVSS